MNDDTKKIGVSLPHFSCDRILDLNQFQRLHEPASHIEKIASERRIAERSARIAFARGPFFSGLGKGDGDPI
jgi:hypothetical protein